MGKIGKMMNGSENIHKATQLFQAREVFVCISEYQDFDEEEPGISDKESVMSLVYAQNITP